MESATKPEYTFVSDGRSPWITAGADMHSSHPVAVDGINKGPWEEYMAFDSQSLSPRSHRSQTKTPVTSRGLPGFFPQTQKLPDGQIPFHLDPNPLPYSIPSTTSAIMPLSFGQTTTDSDFQFSTTAMASQISPFSDYSRTDGIDGWMQKSTTSAHQSNETSNPMTSDTVTPPPSDEHSPQSMVDSLKSTELAMSPPKTIGEHSRKRKMSSEDDDDGDKSDSEKPGSKKTAHNMIEKRYRTNLNDKIAALRDAVPSLRVMCRNTGETDDGQEDLEGLAPAHKLNKATVLSKATEYIRHLQKQRTRDKEEIDGLKARLEQFDRMVKMGTFAYQPSVPTPYSEEMFARGTTNQPPPNNSQGMIPIPESMAQMRQIHMTGPPYSAPGNSFPAYPTDLPNSPVERRRTTGPRGGNMARIMVGGFTTLMLLDGYWEVEHDEKEIQEKGLFSVPVTVLGNLAKRGVMPIASSSPYNTIGILRVTLLLVSVGYLLFSVFSTLFEPAPKRKSSKVMVKTDYSIASPIELRRKAWLTAIQTVWVPQHNFFLEAAALGLKMIKLGIRKLIGWNGYAYITGFTEEQEAARVKAWTTALDAQLTGGDAEISISRLVLSILASGTLPSTPERLMLNALHIRILFWEAANTKYGTWLMLDQLSSKMARSYWNAARREYRATNAGDENSGEDCPLPEHLAALLELDSDDVLVDDIVQRAYNLAWNHSSAEHGVVDGAMDVVVGDVHIASPLDALAAWWSTLVLNRILANSVQGRVVAQDDLCHDVELVLRIAPPPSSARTRGLVAKALLFKENREDHIQAAMQALPPAFESVDDRRSSSLLPTNINLVADGPLPADFSLTLVIAKCLSFADSPSCEDQLSAISSVNWDLPFTTSYTLLSFTANVLLVNRFASSSPLLNDTRLGLEQLTTSLRLWIGSSAASHCGISTDIQTDAIDRCVNVRKSIMGLVDNEAGVDLGYVSQSERSAITGAKSEPLPASSILSSEQESARFSS